MFMQKGVLVLVLLCLVGCLTIGPAYPKKDAKKVLTDEGYALSLIERVLNLKTIPEKSFDLLKKHKDVNVRFLLAQNPTITAVERDFFIDDENAFVRSGLARNESLNQKQIKRLYDDESYLVYRGLAENSMVSKSVLLKLRREKNVSLNAFAMNKKCPLELQEEILNSDDDSAKYWLKFTQGQ